MPKYEIISGVMLHGILRKKGETIELDSENPDALDLLGRNLIEPFRIPEVKSAVEETKEEPFEEKPPGEIKPKGKGKKKKK